MLGIDSIFVNKTTAYVQQSDVSEVKVSPLNTVQQRVVTAHYSSPRPEVHGGGGANDVGREVRLLVRCVLGSACRVAVSRYNVIIFNLCWIITNKKSFMQFITVPIYYKLISSLYSRH